MRRETAEAMMVVGRADGSTGSYMDRVSRQEVEEANTYTNTNTNETIPTAYN